MSEISRERAQAFLDAYKELCARHAIEIDTDFAGAPILEISYPHNLGNLHLHLMGTDWYLSRA